VRDWDLLRLRKTAEGGVFGAVEQLWTLNGGFARSQSENAENEQNQSDTKKDIGVSKGRHCFQPEPNENRNQHENSPINNFRSGEVIFLIR